MDISNINENLDKMKVDKPTKEGITNIIDLKITDDMEKVLQKMDNMEARFTTEMNADRKIFAERTRTFTIVVSVVGTTIALIGIAITILLFLKK